MNSLSLLNRRFLQGLLAILLALFAVALQAKTIFVVSSKSDAIYQEVEQAIRDNVITQDNVRYYYTDLSRLNALAGLKPDFIVTIGSQAMRHYWREQPDVPKLHAFVAFSAYQSLNLEHPISDHKGVIFLDQPLDRQLDLAQKIVPNAKIGLLLSANSQSPVNDFLLQSANQGIVVNYVSEKDELVRQAESLLADIDVLLATPDSLVWRPSSAKWLLYMAYQKRKPVIGFSEALTRAGTVASVYSDPAQIGRQVAESIMNFVGGNSDWSKSTSPKYFRFSVNETIANSLGIDESTLHSIERSN